MYCLNTRSGRSWVKGRRWWDKKHEASGEFQEPELWQERVGVVGTLQGSQRSDWDPVNPPQCKVWKLVADSEGKCGCLKKECKAKRGLLTIFIYFKSSAEKSFCIPNTWAPSERDSNFCWVLSWEGQGTENKRLCLYLGISPLASWRVSLWPVAVILNSELWALLGSTKRMRPPPFAGVLSAWGARNLL